MATIYDVARAAGVSPKTVSRVLNGDAPVGPTTRRRVEDEMARLGYVPSNAARMMRSNRSRLVGLITGAISKNRAPDEPQGLPDLAIVQSVQQAIAEAGMTLMIADTNGQAERVPDLVRTFLQHRVEGLLYVAGHHQQVDLTAEQLDCPLVLVNCFADAGTMAVLPDDRTCQRSLIERVIGAGHRRIGFLTLAPGSLAGKLRLQGYRDALAAADIAFDPALALPGQGSGHGPESEHLTAGVDRLLQLPEPPTVICCGKDAMAMRIYGVLRSRGMRIPETISVAGFDDYRVISETLFPPLTTVELPYPAMGRRAAESLLATIRGEPVQSESPLLVAGQVAWRSSVAAFTSADTSDSKRRDEE